MKQRAVFLDRDGTLNEQMGYINHISRFKLLPGTGAAIRALNRSGFLVIVVTNQSGVARGYFPVELVDEVHARMVSLLAKEGARIDGIFYCPHHERGIVADFRKTCDCRKPKTGLIEQACRKFEIDLSRSCVVGDRSSDLEMAYRAGLHAILVLTGYGLGDQEYILPALPEKPAFVAANLQTAVEWIIQREPESQ